MKKKGFTLIELLAVITVLGAVALILTPEVNRILKNARMSAFKDTAYHVVEAAKLYYQEQEMDEDHSFIGKTFYFPEAEGLNIKGEHPKDGAIRINSSGEISLAASNGKYCARKDYDSAAIKLDTDLDSCNIRSISILESTNNCVYDETICPTGLAVTVNVNDTTPIIFNVIKDSGEELTLLSNTTLVSSAWSSSYSSGPVTLLDAIDNYTSSWTNIEPYDYKLYNDSDGGNGTYTYPAIVRKNARARLLTLTEANELGCTTDDRSCSEFLQDTTLSTLSTTTGQYYRIFYYIDGGFRYAVRSRLVTTNDSTKIVIKVSKDL